MRGNPDNRFIGLIDLILLLWSVVLVGYSQSLS